MKDIDLSKIIKIVGVYIAMIVGAGFASGQELLQFFVRYGRMGIWGIILSGIIFTVVGYAVMSICLDKKYESSEEFIKNIFGENFGGLLEIIIALLFLTFYFAMVSATGSALKQVFNINFSFGAFVFSILCFVCLSKDIDGILKMNAVFAPIMVVGGIVTGMYILMAQNTEVFSNNSLVLETIKNNWFSSGIIYASYNIVTSISVLAAVSHIVNDKKNALTGAIVSGGILVLLGLFLIIPLMNDFEFIKQFELPMLALIYKHNYALEYLYLIILMLAIFSTAVGNAFIFMEFLRKRVNLNPHTLKIILCICGFFTAHLGFSNIVRKIYPVFGIIGFLEIIAITYAFVRNRERKENVK